MSEEAKQLCHKCGKPMMNTPVCLECGIIPIAEGSFQKLERELAESRAQYESLFALGIDDARKLDKSRAECEKLRRELAAANLRYERSAEQWRWTILIEQRDAARAACDKLRLELADMTADRDSWREQSDQRGADCVRLAAERDAAHECIRNSGGDPDAEATPPQPPTRESAFQNRRPAHDRP